MVIKILLVRPPQKNKKQYFLSYHLFIPPPCITYSVKYPRSKVPKTECLNMKFSENGNLKKLVIWLKNLTCPDIIW